MIGQYKHSVVYISICW